MSTDIDRLIRDADPAHDLNLAPPNAASARTPPQRDRSERARVMPVRVVGGALSVAVVLGVVVLAITAGHHVLTGTSATRRPTNERRGTPPVSAMALPSHYYCMKRGETATEPCSARPLRGFVHVGVTSEVLVDARFTAPVAVDSKHRFYEATFHLTRSAGCDAGALGSPSTTTIAVGQRVTLQAFVPLSCPGVVRVTVRYVPDHNTPGNRAVLPPGTRLLGRTTVSIH
jgi:hypothetical protein